MNAIERAEELTTEYMLMGVRGNSLGMDMERRFEDVYDEVALELMIQYVRYQLFDWKVSDKEFDQVKEDLKGLDSYLMNGDI